jgi:precorrin-6B methylase 2
MNQEQDHVWINFENEAKKPSNPGRERKEYLSRKRLVPVFPSDSSTIIVLTPETVTYRQMACAQLLETDCVLEIGCSTGECASALLRYGQSWVGFDTSSDMISRCTAHLRASGVGTGKSWHAVKMDALSDPKRALETAKKFSSPAGPTVVFIDIGGNREQKVVLRMMSWTLQSLPRLRLMIVKSRELTKDLSTSKSAECRVDAYTGVVENGSTWFIEKTKEEPRHILPKHPLQAPMVYSPTDSTKPICRYFNFHKDGCAKGSECLYDHEHCHLCLSSGHKALFCALITGNTRTPSEQNLQPKAGESEQT